MLSAVMYPVCQPVLLMQRLYQRWEFGELPQWRQLDHGGVSVRVFPALVDETTGVSLSYRDDARQAEQETQQGLARLAMLESRRSPSSWS